jgi:hypothetical protein
MAKKLLFLILLVFVNLIINAQTVSGKIINNISLNPIENVAIITNIKTGTISNKLGKYIINLKNVSTITFSCLGYQSKTVSKNLLIKRNYNIKLIENINQLDEIQLNIAKISLDSLLIKTAKSMKENYLSEAVKQELNAIESQKMDFKKLDLELKSSSLLSRESKKLAEQELKTFSENLQNRKPEFTSAFKASVFTKEKYSKKAKKTFTTHKIENIKGFKKANIGEGITVKNITEKLQNIVLKYLNSDKTYKIKSGLFKVEDSLSLKKVSKISDSIKKENSFSNFNATNYSRDVKNIGTFYKTSSEKNFLNRKYYNHNLEINEVLGVLKYYVISFKPRKSKAKYSGKIYIDPSDFSIKKITYKFAKGKRGEHLNLKFLLGIKFSENEHNVTIYYEKNEDNKIYVSYFNEAKTSYAYINRPLKFIENTIDKNKVKFNIKVEINVFQTTEVLLKNTIYVDASSIKSNKKEDFKKRTNYLSKEAYNNTNWKNRLQIKEYLKNYE